MSEKKLTNITLSAVQKQVARLVDAQKAIQAARKESRRHTAKDEYAAALKQAEAEKARLNEARFKLYDDLQKGVVSRDEYDFFRNQYANELLAKDTLIQQLQNSIESMAGIRKADDAFVAFFEKFGNIQVLDRSVMVHLIDRIVVNSAQNVCVYFKFSGERGKIFDLAQAI